MNKAPQQRRRGPSKPPGRNLHSFYSEFDGSVRFTIFSDFVFLTMGRHGREEKKEHDYILNICKVHDAI